MSLPAGFLMALSLTASDSALRVGCTHAVTERLLLSVAIDWQAAVAVACTVPLERIVFVHNMHNILNTDRTSNVVRNRNEFFFLTRLSPPQKNTNT